MTFTVGGAINEGRKRAKQDPRQIRYPNEAAFLRVRGYSLASEVPVTIYNKIIADWLAAGR